MEQAKGKEKEKSYSYEDVIKDVQSGNIGRAVSMGFGEMVKTIMGNDNASIDGQVKDGQEKESSLFDKMKDFFSDLGDKSPFSAKEQSGLFAVSKVVDQVFKTGEDMELSYKDQGSISFSKENGTVKAYDDKGFELNFGDVAKQSGQMAQSMENDRTDDLSEMISGFKSKEAEAQIGENAIGGVLGMLSKMLGLDQSQIGIK